MKVLVINAGSSSLKYQLIDMTNESALAVGLCERIGIDNSIITQKKFDGKKLEKLTDLPTHKDALEEVVKALTDDEFGVIKDMGEINAVGHRVVHGGEKFTTSALYDEGVEKAIKDCFELAPLHNPPNMMGISACAEIMPGTPMVIVFDTAFHQTMPPYAYMYALPYDLYEKHGVRKYGFHGTSHKYVAERAALMLGKPAEETKIITCHLGNGSSITAVEGGKSVETSMGFTPLEGLAMGTRCGSIDPAIVPFLMEKEGLTTREIDTLMNKKSGVLGVSGLSNDFRDLDEAASKGNRKAELALEIFAYKVKKFIGEYSAVLNGADAVVFTAGIGENSASIRKRILTGLDGIGIKIDDEKNKIRGQEIDISTPDAKVRVFVIPTNEELAIARETKEIVETEVKLRSSIPV
ncbi:MULTISPECIES: acetate kinase [unclassified Methanosarcina]|uniref:Acetate kinase n=2 Tax=Methanosarcina thermophila TaxID=2210 RepID=ACKA_METTE|nr:MULTISPECIES: acetate kinase [unclassified Methanosarcina]P38502.1 RecName: Full=Acetate kinase; AltName: Full=Acetokinase [Methanosarcina thermophila]1G99_A Chain A, ACETATE KINASE [Methanosarcina thermophila]1G99_B Chain B, ACETATE KINASE [Methanosarcina thermophila]AAA72042.1 acetate kinase [Methanosarcina thermophila]AKB19564.1 Acetate kinase [Methanosarcina sp. WWM596]AKB22602.1 Acetate kinase [Methanosarcina sp. WH1]